MGSPNWFQNYTTFVLKIVLADMGYIEVHYTKIRSDKKREKIKKNFVYILLKCTVVVETVGNQNSDLTHKTLPFT